jgi:RNA polymerase sigma-70 factor, ECF subfamily
MIALSQTAFQMDSSGRFIHLEPPDEALCARVAEHDVAAFEALYERYRDRVFAWAAHVLGPRQAEDTTQEVFALLWRRAGQFNQSRGQFTHWFWALTRNHILRELRGMSRQRRIQMADQIAGLISTAIAEGVDVEEAAFAKVDSQRALDTLGRLPPEQRRVLVMSYFVGLSHAAIAEELSLPLGTVKKRARLGMQKLRQALLADAEPEEQTQQKGVRPNG